MKIGDLAVLIEGTVDGDDSVDVTGLSAIASAGVGDLTFALDEKRLGLAEKSRSSCVLTGPSIRTSSKPLIRVTNPKLAFLFSYRILCPLQPRSSFIHPSAAVASTVKLGHEVHIGAQVFIDGQVTIGDNVIIESGCVISENCFIGSGCHLYPRVMLYPNTLLKENVILHAGVVLGCDGFGYIKDRGTIHKFPQLGKVVINENVEIGANTTIDRGSLDDTVIGANSKIDNLCHIAHNVKIGRNVIMAAQCGIAGGTVIGDDVTMSGQIAVIDNVIIGKNATIGGKSGIIGNIEDGSVVWGMPAKPLAVAKKQMAVVSWLTKNFSPLSKLIKDKRG